MKPGTTTTERSPLLPHSQTLPAQHGNWKSSLADKTPRSIQTWTASSQALIREFRRNPWHVPDDWAFRGLLCDLMFHGEADALHRVLSQEPLRNLRINSLYAQKHRDLSVALQTLLEAMPDQWPVKEMTLTNQHLDEKSCSLLFEVFKKVPALESLNLYKLSVDNPWLGLPTCSQPLKLKNLRLENTHEASPFLERILEASPQLSVLYLDSNHGFTVKEHQSLAQALKRLLGLGELTLRQLRYGENENIGPVLHSYAEFLANQTTLGHLDVSGNPLTSDHCTVLWKALQDKTHLTSLSLAGCWRHKENADPLALLVRLNSLASLDLSGNQFFNSTEVVVMSLAYHSGLLHLNLDSSMEDEPIDALASFLANNKTLISLELPVMSDDLYGKLVTDMQKNQTLRSLSIKGIDAQLSLMTPEQRHRNRPNYLALMDCIARNRAQWEEQNVKN